MGALEYWSSEVVDYRWILDCGALMPERSDSTILGILGILNFRHLWSTNPSTRFTRSGQAGKRADGPTG